MAMRYILNETLKNLKNMHEKLLTYAIVWHTITFACV